MSDYRHLRIERQGHVAQVILDRPDRLNALSLDLLEELEQLAVDLRDDADSRVVVLSGVGRHFSAGADLGDGRAAERAEQPLILRRRNLRLGERVVEGLHHLDQLTVAAIHGGALGGAACIVSALDLRIGSDDCFIAYPEIDLGMNLMWMGLAHLVRLVGPARAKQAVILGRRVQSAELERWGFLDEVVSGDQLMPRALELAAELASKPPVQAQMIKRSVNALSGALDRSILHMEADQWQLAASTRDAQKARAAQADGGSPQFEGD